MSLLIDRTSSAAGQLRLGNISFLNTLPVVIPFERRRVNLNARFSYGEPAQLNTALEGGELDVSAVSSFYYLQARRFTLIPGICISSMHEVGSVLLFSKVEPFELRKVMVPRTSATSVALLRVLLAERFGVYPEFVRESRSACSLLDRADLSAACVFGDRALMVDSSWTAHMRRFDLGTWWYELTGLPMVFGVWAARNSWYAANPQLYAELGTRLREAVNMGLGEMFHEVMAEARARSGLPEERLFRYYLNQLSFDLTPGHIEGLETFERLCRKHELL